MHGAGASLPWVHLGRTEHIDKISGEAAGRIAEPVSLFRNQHVVHLRGEQSSCLFIAFHAKRHAIKPPDRIFPRDIPICESRSWIFIVENKLESKAIPIFKIKEHLIFKTLVWGFVGH